MGRAAPAVIIITRHGARLDAEDKDWQQNSETPYDSPLSYGGWTQTRALGARIASLLRQRDVALNDDERAATKRRASDDLDVKSSPTNPDQIPITGFKRRKHKVIIHSSPFLRCVQSSLAMCAGMAQYRGNLAKFEAARASKPSRTSSSGRKASGPARSRTLDANAMESTYGSASPASTLKAIAESSSEDVQSKFLKPILRVDACLGEWLAEDYFEHIKPPPASDVMVATAKAQLSREASPLQGARDVGSAITEQPPPLDLNSAANKTPEESLSLGELDEALPDEAKSANGNEPALLKNKTKANTHRRRSQDVSLPKGYAPPVPTYAISTHAAIPPGFVAHARDACANFDLPWDSMMSPQLWGDGGELQEEWSSMHRRFRKALMEMITWYKQNGPYYNPQAEESDSGKDETMDEDEDIVLVIVTHGAGCNALIGALTNQPVLMDVGMGSLTMAVHKELLPSPSSANLSKMNSMSSSGSRRRSSVDTSQASEYEMKLLASTDHLRAGADPLNIPQLQSPTLASIPEGGPRDLTWSPPSSGSSTPRLQERSKNSSLGSIRRSRATTMGGSRSVSEDLPSPSGSGLWASRQPSTSSTPHMTIREESESGETVEGQVRANSDIGPPPRKLSGSSQRGLWGSGPHKKPVRRWTINEKD